MLGLYAAEGKQYGVDAFVTVLVLFQIARPGALIDRWKTLLLTGTFAVLMSHSSVFILFAAGVVLMFERESRLSRKNFFLAVAVPAFWGAIFLLMIAVSLGSNMHDSTLHRFWKHAFAPSITNPGKYFFWLSDVLQNWMQVAFGEARRYGPHIKLS